MKATAKFTPSIQQKHVGLGVKSLTTRGIHTLLSGFSRMVFDNSAILSFLWISFCRLWLKSSTILKTGGGAEGTGDTSEACSSESTSPFWREWSAIQFHRPRSILKSKTILFLLTGRGKYKYCTQVLAQYDAWFKFNFCRFLKKKKHN